MKTSPIAGVVAVVASVLLSIPSAGPVLAASASDFRTRATEAATSAAEASSAALLHTALKSSNPKKSAQVEGLKRVTLVFTESVRFPVVVVLGAGEKRFEDGKPKVDGPKVTAGVVDNLPPGKYTVAWRVVSRDGHPLEGEIPFTVVASASPAASPAQSPPVENGPATSAPAASEVAPSPVQAESAEAAAQSSRGIPAWVWIVIFGVAGIGIGMAFSMRKRP